MCVTDLINLCVCVHTMKYYATIKKEASKKERSTWTDMEWFLIYTVKGKSTIQKTMFCLLFLYKGGGGNKAYTNLLFFFSQKETQGKRNQKIVKLVIYHCPLKGIRKFFG